MLGELWRATQRGLVDSLRGRVHSGQTLVLGALMMTSLIAMTGLTIDVGVWLVAKARLQRGVDAAALSVILDRPIPTQTGDSTKVATIKARDIILSQGIPTSELGTVTTSIPRSNRLTVTATQQVATAFARVIGVNSATINAQATSDINTYLEIPVSPVCGGAVSGSSVVCDGGVGDSTMDQFGLNRSHTFGDAYTNPSSPFYNGPDGQPVLPEGYLYRVDVDPGYTGALDIQVFDVDTFNQNNPPQWLGACPPAVPTDPCVANPTYSALNDLRQGPGASFPSIARNYYANGYHLFWRVDECNSGSQTCQAAGDMVPIRFTLWSLAADAPDPLNPLPGERTDIQTRSFGPSGGSVSVTDTFTCTAPSGADSGCPDLRWIRLFHIPNVGVYPTRSDGSRSFFIYVKALGGDSENVYHLRSGPPPGDPDQNPCQKSGVGGRSNYESVNNQASCPWSNGRPGAYTKIYAWRSMPVNVMQAAAGGVPYVVWLGYVPKTAAGQTLRLRNYDLDRPGSPACPPGSSATNVSYRAWFTSDDRRTTLASPCGSANGVWQEDLWTVPAASNTAFWGSDQGFWLYADVFQKNQSTPFWDTAVFEVLFNRARLVG